MGNCECRLCCCQIQFGSGSKAKPSQLSPLIDKNNKATKGLPKYVIPLPPDVTELPDVGVAPPDFETDMSYFDSQRFTNNPFQATINDQEDSVEVGNNQTLQHLEKDQQNANKYYKAPIETTSNGQKAISSPHHSDKSNQSKLDLSHFNTDSQDSLKKIEHLRNISGQNPQEHENDMTEADLPVNQKVVDPGHLGSSGETETEGDLTEDEHYHPHTRALSPANKDNKTEAIFSEDDETADEKVAHLFRPQSINKWSNQLIRKESKQIKKQMQFLQGEQGRRSSSYSQHDNNATMITINDQPIHNLINENIEQDVQDENDNNENEDMINTDKNDQNNNNNNNNNDKNRQYLNVDNLDANNIATNTDITTDDGLTTNAEEDDDEKEYEYDDMMAEYQALKKQQRQSIHDRPTED